LSPAAFDEIKLEEDKKIMSLNEKYESDMKELREEMKKSDLKHDEQLSKIISLIQENPKLAKLKTEVLSEI
jgi:hypothetical protein